MKTIRVRLKSVTPYSPSKFHDIPKQEREAADAFEARTWRERAHYRSDGQMFIPPMAFKKSLEAAAKYLGMQIKGRGKATYSKHFTSGVLIMDEVLLPTKKDDVPGVTVFVHANGKDERAGRVKRTFPLVQEWEADATFYILDPTITEEIFIKHLEESGKMIGVGRFRPEKGGVNGRFRIVNWEVLEDDEKAAA